MNGGEREAGRTQAGAVLGLHEQARRSSAEGLHGGVRVPEDIAIVSFDGSELGEYSWPPLTTVAQPIEDMARAAVDLMIDGGGETTQQVFAPSLLIRRSCGC